MKIHILSSLLVVFSISGVTLGLDLQSGLDTIQNVPLNVIGPSNESLSDTQKDLSKRVFFYLYTRDTQNNPEMLYVDDPNTLKQSRFDPKKKTVFITHGWATSCSSESCNKVREEYQKHGDYNVIVVDWSKISKMSYLEAVKRVQMVAEYVAVMIDILNRERVLPELILVGHSLGAQIVGLAGYNAKSEVDYVVGLDPAYPLFNFASPSHRLSTESAKFVLAIHTNAGLNGFLTPIAHCDVYANDGITQPGCGTNVSCSHGRAYEYFAESINSEVGFWARQCDNSLEFRTGLCNLHPLVRVAGAEPDVNIKGVYYVKTRSSPPYALGRNN
ncbi:endothelial lipase-like [Hylaeus volcanicus]|uniref:endothelial lipase-like n=1 Tax=Hylaeus volcanicus TaxID=313075 RepID=UPI0023B80EE8|nr:endothelial lipase-like [Hylaeus volcanicus]